MLERYLYVFRRTTWFQFKFKFQVHRLTFYISAGVCWLHHFPSLLLVDICFAISEVWELAAVQMITYVIQNMPQIKCYWINQIIIQYCACGKHKIFVFGILYMVSFTIFLTSEGNALPETIGQVGYLTASSKIKPLL